MNKQILKIAEEKLDKQERELVRKMKKQSFFQGVHRFPILTEQLDDGSVKVTRRICFLRPGNNIDYNVVSFNDVSKNHQTAILNVIITLE